MGLLIWVTMGVALWHFAIFIPDRFWGGIVGSLIFAAIFAVLAGLIVNGFAVPGNSEVTIATAWPAVPGTLIGLALCYLIGVKRGNKALDL